MKAILRLWAIALAVLAGGLIFLALPHAPWVRAAVGSVFLGVCAWALTDAADVAIRKRRP
jgi:hypothetical protein